MDVVDITVTVEDNSGVIFKEVVSVPRTQVITPGHKTPGLKAIADALSAVYKI